MLGIVAACIVSFRTSDGKLWCHVTAAQSTHEAVREGWNFFQDPFWRGPKPTRETVFEISLVGDERRWWIRAQDGITALRQNADQPHDRLCHIAQNAAALRNQHK
jgi:hypothetical protein